MSFESNPGDFQRAALSVIQAQAGLVIVIVFKNVMESQELKDRHVFVVVRNEMNQFKICESVRNSSIVRWCTSGCVMLNKNAKIAKFNMTLFEFQVPKME